MWFVAAILVLASAGKSSEVRRPACAQELLAVDSGCACLTSTVIFCWDQNVGQLFSLFLWLVALTCWHFFLRGIITCDHAGNMVEVPNHQM